jgi:hypothetical protein
MIGVADAVLVMVAAPTKPQLAAGTSSPSMAPHRSVVVTLDGA